MKQNKIILKKIKKYVKTKCNETHSNQITNESYKKNFAQMLRWADGEFSIRQLRSDSPHLLC